MGGPHAAAWQQGPAGFWRGSRQQSWEGRARRHVLGGGKERQPGLKWVASSSGSGARA